MLYLTNRYLSLAIYVPVLAAVIAGQLDIPTFDFSVSDIAFAVYLPPVMNFISQVVAVSEWCIRTSNGFCH